MKKAKFWMFCRQKNKILKHQLTMLITPLNNTPNKFSTLVQWYSSISNSFESSTKLLKLFSSHGPFEWVLELSVAITYSRGTHN